MADLSNRSFPLGWTPDADAVNGPDGILLRADNLVLDEMGAVSLRAGSQKINASPLGGPIVHSLFAVMRNGVQFIYAGAGGALYRNSVAPAAEMGGEGDISFGAYLGYVFVARGPNRLKDDGTNIRKWGIEMTGEVPSIQSTIGPSVNSLATWDSGEFQHSIQEGKTTTLAYAPDQDQNENSAVVLFPSPTTGRGVITRTFNADTDLEDLGGGDRFDDGDVISMWMFVADSVVARRLTIQVDVNGGGFDKDFYMRWWDIIDGVLVDPGSEQPGPGEGGGGGDGTPI